MTTPRCLPESLGRRRIMQWLAATGVLAATPRVAAAQSPSNYKALVCIYLDGGNDGENTLVRFDTAGYQTYAAVRTPASGLNIPQAQLLPIQPARGGPPFGFHPACGAFKTLFDQKRLAVVANTGQLMAPSTKAGLEVQGAPRPANLFSHSDQTLAQQSADGRGFTRIGWGGRIADKLDVANEGTVFPALVSTSSARSFCNGRTSIPLTVPGGGFYGLSATGATSKAVQFNALLEAALRELASHPRENAYDAVTQYYAEQGLSSVSVVAPMLNNPSSIVPAFFSGLSNDASNQLRTVAMMIESRARTALRRQVFYVNHFGYDTHGSQLGTQQTLLGNLASGIEAFTKAMDAMGLAESVTTFTLSDFGRTFKPAGNNGTDHGWGNYAFVVGGAVKGGDFYGTVPTMALNGPDDLGNAGRWIPTTSLEQYGATLARWFGIAEGDLPYVFPNLGAFANTNLGFMA